MARWADSARSLAVLLAFLGGGGVEMADGDGEGIGGVGGFGNLGEIEKASHHLLDLMSVSYTHLSKEPPLCSARSAAAVRNFCGRGFR